MEAAQLPRYAVWERNGFVHDAYHWRRHLSHTRREKSAERLTRNERAQNEMKVSASGLCFLVVLVAVSYIGCLLVVSPALLLLPISLSIYRRWTDYFLALWFYLSPVSERNSN